MAHGKAYTPHRDGPCRTNVTVVNCYGCITARAVLWLTIAEGPSNLGRIGTCIPCAGRILPVTNRGRIFTAVDRAGVVRQVDRGIEIEDRDGNTAWFDPLRPHRWRITLSGGRVIASEAVAS